MRASVRFPLQTGASALVAMGRATGMLTVAAVFFGTAATCAGFDSGPLAFSMLATPGLYFFAFSLFRLRLVAQRRASDIILSPSGLTIEGGARHGTTLSWTDVEPWRSEVVVSDESLSATGGTDVGRLVLGLRGGDTMLLAEAQTMEERASLEALLASLRSSRWHGGPSAHTAEGAADVAAPRIFACTSCGAPAEPADVDVVQCAYCGASIVVTSELRARMRAAALAVQSNPAMQQEVARILSQPTAEDVNARLVGVAIGGPVLGLTSLIAEHPGIYMAAAGFLLCLFTGVVSATGQRRAFRALVHLGAVEPERAGAPHSCRRCLAPLPRAMRGTIVVACIHCHTANVLGLDLRRQAHEAAGATAELASALSVRRFSRVLTLVAMIVGVGLIVAGGFVWWVGPLRYRHTRSFDGRSATPGPIAWLEPETEANVSLGLPIVRRARRLTGAG